MGQNVATIHRQNHQCDHRGCRVADADASCGYCEAMGRSLQSSETTDSRTHRSRRRVGSVTVALTAALAACGSSGPQSSVSVNSAATATSGTTVTTAAGTTLAGTTAAPVTVIVTVVVTSATTVAVTDAPTLPPAPTQAPPAQTKPKTTTPKTAAPTTIPALYAEVSPPVPPKNNTSDVPDNGSSLPDGVYWVDYTGGEQDTPAMRVQQAFFGDACVAKAAETAQTCDNGLFVPSSPDREMKLPFASSVKLTVSDERTKKSYRITPDELVRIRASSPSSGAPDGYGFTNFRFLMTFAGGKITKFEQLWTAN